MKTSNQTREMETQKQNLCIVSEDFLSNMLDSQNKIIELLEGQKNNGLNGFITEKQAMQILMKKATWFWQLRKDGKIPFKRIGKTVYYCTEDIHSLLQKSAL